MSGVTFRVAKHEASKVTERSNVETSEFKEDVVAKSDKPNESRIEFSNGFVYAASTAYNEHHHLVIRPDDVWLAIVVQFSAYMLKNGEALRTKFVGHEGQVELKVDDIGTLRTANYANLCNKMQSKIAESIKDPSVRDWVLPAFTTTTDKDKVVGAIALMASMQSFFTYKFCLKCGIPSVTLLGTVADWELLEKKARRLLEFDTDAKYMQKWYAMLQPILENLTKSARNDPSIEWWSRICNTLGGGSGPRYLSGWITAFCVFDDKGEWRGDDKLYGGRLDAKKKEYEWPVINTNDIQSGVCTVPVTVEEADRTEYKCELRAGHASCTVVKEGRGLQPNVEWVLVLKNQ